MRREVVDGAGEAADSEVVLPGSDQPLREELELLEGLARFTAGESARNDDGQIGRELNGRKATEGAKAGRQQQAIASVCPPLCGQQDLSRPRAARAWTNR